MPRLPHGTEITPGVVRAARNSVADRAADIPLGFALAKPADTRWRARPATTSSLSGRP